MFPEIPSNLSELTSAELRTLADEIRSAAEGLTRNEDGSDRTPSAEEATLARQALAIRRTQIVPLANRREIEEALSVVDPDDPDIDEDDDEDDDDVPEPGDETKASNHPALRRVHGTVGVTTEAVPGGFTPNALVAVDSIDNVRAGDTLDSWTQLAELMLSKRRALRGNMGEKFNVAKVEGNFTPDRILDDNKFFNLNRFDEEEMTAALCAPLTPVYTLACMNTTRRPVRASLATYRAPRFGVKIYPSPSLSAVAGSAGIWTSTLDAIASADKEDCATITCATPVDYLMYGVYWCLTVKNMLAMSFPELLEAYLNRGAANHARIAEIQLLQSMATTATAITAPVLGYGASTRISTQLMHYLALYQEQQRWDAVEWELWAPRWLQTAVRIDMARRNTRDGQWRVATEADADRIFTNAGFTPHWFIDNPGWDAAWPSPVTGGNLTALPSGATVLVAPRGKYALMDGGQLDIGVTGNNIYRDNVSNSRNEFTFFFENFEGIVDTTSCPAAKITFNGLCFNGAQIADVTINCAGV